MPKGINKFVVIFIKEKKKLIVLFITFINHHLTNMSNMKYTRSEMIVLIKDHLRHNPLLKICYVDRMKKVELIDICAEYKLFPDEKPIKKPVEFSFNSLPFDLKDKILTIAKKKMDIEKLKEKLNKDARYEFYIEFIENENNYFYEDGSSYEDIIDNLHEYVDGCVSLEHLINEEKLDQLKNVIEAAGGVLECIRLTDEEGCEFFISKDVPRMICVCAFFALYTYMRDKINGLENISNKIKENWKYLN